MSDDVNDWVIWSFEHNAWWGANQKGYVGRLMWAGLYSEKEAKEIQESANRNCKPGKWNELAHHITTAIRKEMADNPCQWGQKVGDVLLFPITRADTEREPCERCAGCGEIADDEDGTPWKYWLELPYPSDLAVRTGIVKALPCPECKGSTFKS